MHRNLIILGTSSGAGKSITVAGLCRIIKNDGFSVTPFKTHNLSLNSYITVEGKEIGRAQVTQAIAAKLTPLGYMNPILIKHNSLGLSQIIVNGKSRGNMTWKEFREFKKNFKGELLDIYKSSVSDKFDICVLEGAGSPSEINVDEDDSDIVNLGMARLVNAPAILVGDIDRGGVFGSIYGTIMLMKEEDRKRVKGIIINKFRGHRDILEPGIKKLEELLGIPVLGVVPFADIDLEDEDSVNSKLDRATFGKIKIAIIRNAHISNFNDFDNLSTYPDVGVTYARNAKDLEDADLVIIPGTKNTIDDYLEMKELGVWEKLKTMKDTPIIGICGGLQMLGRSISDPHKIEGNLGCVETLGLLDIDTVMEYEKNTTQFSGNIPSIGGIFSFLKDIYVEGYEIHQGVSKHASDKITFFGKDNIFATYLHGIFDNKEFSDAILNYIREKKNIVAHYSTLSFNEYRENELNKLEKLLRENLNMKEIYRIMEENIIK